MGEEMETGGPENNQPAVQASIQEQLPDFNGKAVLLYLDRAAGEKRASEYLFSPAFQLQGERLFLVGKHPSAGAFTIGVPWESVRKYVVADSFEAFRQYASS